MPARTHELIITPPLFQTECASIKLQRKMFNCADIPEIQNLWQTKSGSTPGFGREHLVTTDTEAVLFMLHLSVQPFSHMCCICVFVYLCIFVFVYLCKDRGTPRQPFSIC